MFLVRYSICFAILLFGFNSIAQVKWINVDSIYAPLPSTVQVFKTTDSLDGKPFIAFYVKAKLKDKKLDFTTDTTLGRRLTPLQFYEKNNQPLVVVNCTFFNFDKNQNLNVVIKDGKLVGYNIHTIPMRGKDTFQYRHPLGSALGIDKKRNADVAWALTDSSKKFAYVSQLPMGKAIKEGRQYHPCGIWGRVYMGSYIGEMGLLGDLTKSDLEKCQTPYRRQTVETLSRRQT